MKLSSLQNTSRPYKRRKVVGRGIGSHRGKTCCRGEKGAGSRSGYKRRWSYEGGQFRLFMKMPIRGFSNARFRIAPEAINLDELDAVYQDGEVVSLETLLEKGLIKGRIDGVKILANGELTKKVTIQIEKISDGAREKLGKAKIHFTES